MSRRPPGSSGVQWLNRRDMSVRAEDSIPLCQRALQIVTELCLTGHVDREKCSDIFPLESNIPGKGYADISISLLAVVVGFCGLALLVVSLFVFWKLCWPIWRSKALSAHAENAGLHVGFPEAPPPSSPPISKCKVAEVEKKYPPEVTANGRSSVKLLEAAMKISQTSPDIPAEVQTALKEKLSQQAKIQRQTTEPTSSSRHNSFRRHLPRQMNVTSVDFSMETVPLRQSSTVSIGRIKPELYKQKSVDSEGEPKEPVETCGKLSFSLRYDYEEQALVVRILKALDLPAKDFTGTSDPYVKIYLLPERKKKYQTRVHRKNLNPMFDETFCFPVVYDEICNRKLHFSVYDFDRFTSHDMIGEVVVDNLFELSDLSREAVVWKDIHAATTESVDLGEIMYSLCYLPTAGRMTLTVIKCRNLKAMDITGSSDPYVKVHLICDGRRLKKRKTTTKKSTLNPVYNEAIIFDIPPENVEQVSLSIMVMDYDRVGHNEVIGVCRAGPDAEGLGRDHWNEMLAYPRKPITHWHALGEWPGRGASFESQGSCPSPKPPLTP
ncbi:synaptotagmin-10 isoform X1 [Solea senegalensis]|uniref:Synaptotagmin-10 isoform X1 n=1 Tax=Solea senegalensis TaxID=28829 RepID=A0AAV6QWR8_SOLSE|nr:synaptotagmin-10 isoform X1 [Solea senegalensis]KAG7497496.1 synaptotagmin-10 isoform X1 [Solea senegalensis]